MLFLILGDFWLNLKLAIQNFLFYRQPCVFFAVVEKKSWLYRDYNPVRMTKRILRSKEESKKRPVQIFKYFGREHERQRHDGSFVKMRR